MKKTGWFRKLTSISLSLLLLMTAFPVYAEEVAVEPAPQAEYIEVAGIVEEPVESDVPAIIEESEPEIIEEASDAPAEIAETEYAEEEADAAAEESAAQDAQPAAQNDAASQELLIIQQFFGVGDIAPEEEDFYRALFSYARMRGPGGMPMTIALSGGETVVFDGGMHQVAYTQGTITSQVPLPPSYVVTFEAQAQGRLPGVYNPYFTSVSIMNGSVNMTGFFDVGVTGGALEIMKAGSFVMILTDDAEVDFNGLDQEVEVTTGEAYVNWMPLSDELRVVVKATGEGTLIGEYEMTVESYAIEVIDDGEDITEYFDMVFASAGQLEIVPPENPIGVQIVFDDVEIMYNGLYQEVIVTTNNALIDGEPMSDKLLLQATGMTGDMMSFRYIELADYSVVVREDETDITDYFEAFSNWACAVFVAPEEPIPLEIRVEDIEIPYNYNPYPYPSVTLVHYTAYVNGEPTPVTLKGFGLNNFSQYLTADPGTYQLTQDDWSWIQLYGYWYWDSWPYWIDSSWHDITILPSTLTVLP